MLCCLALSSATIASTVFLKAALSPIALDFTRLTSKSLRAIAVSPPGPVTAAPITKFRIRNVDANCL